MAYQPQPVPTSGPGLSRQGRSTGARLLVIAAVALAALVGTYAFFVRTSVGQQLDNALLAGQRYDLESNSAAAEDLLRSFTVVALVLGVGVAVLVPALRRRPRLALASVAVIGSAMLANELLKEYLLTRPPLDDVPLYLQQNSFPSGHTTTAMAAGVALVLGVPYRLRGAAALAAAGFATVIGTATLRAAWHRLSDLIGSYLLVLTIAALVAAAVTYWRDVSPPPASGGGSQRWLSGCLGGLLGGLAVVGFLGGLALATATLAATVLQGEYELRGARSVDVVALAFWVSVASAGVLAGLGAARRPPYARRHGGIAAAALTAGGLLALLGGTVTLLATWREITVGFPGELALLWAYRLAAFAGHGVCFLAVAALLAGLAQAELDPPRPARGLSPGRVPGASPADRYPPAPGSPVVEVAGPGAAVLPPEAVPPGAAGPPPASVPPTARLPGTQPPPAPPGTQPPAQQPPPPSPPPGTRPYGP